MEIIRSVINYLLANTANIIIALVKGGLVFFIGWKLAKWIVKVLKKSKAFKKLDAGIESFVASLIEVLLKALVVIAVVSVIGIDLSAAVTALASVGLTFGLAFQGALSNLAGGFIILVFRPFKVGDYIDTHTDSGTVESIAIFHTRLRTPDNKIISIPNGTLSNSSIINYSALPTRRLDFSFNVEHGTDINKVKQVLVAIAQEQNARIKDQPIVCNINTFTDSAIGIVLRFWVSSEDYWDTYFDVNEKVNEAFGENGIVIPSQQLTIHTNSKTK